MGFATLDPQIIFNVVVGLAAFFGGYSLSQITKTLDRLDADVRQLPILYVSKADYRDDLKSISTKLGKIFDKLDEKADKS